jgi:hypothetical protein
MRINTFDTVQTAMHLCSKLAGARDSLPMILWEDEDVFHLDGCMGSMSGLHALVKGELEDAKRILHDQVMLGCSEEGMTPPRERMLDQLRNARPGYNFLQDPSNPFKAAQHRLALKILEHETHGPVFSDVDEMGDVKHNRKAILEWMAKVQSFLEKLFVIVHLTIGLPPRGTEACETLLVNTLNAERNVYVVLQEFCVVGRYNKTSHNTGFDKPIPRAVHADPAQLAMEYLTLVRPLQRYFARFVVDEGLWGYFDTHLWVGVKGKWTSLQISNMLKEATYQYLHVSIGLASWRHLATSIMRKKLKGQTELQSEIQDWMISCMADEQAGHSAEVAAQFYGGEVTGMAHGMNENECKRYMTVSRFRIRSVTSTQTSQGEPSVAQHHGIEDPRPLERRSRASGPDSASRFEPRDDSVRRDDGISAVHDGKSSGRTSRSIHRDSRKAAGTAGRTV